MPQMAALSERSQRLEAELQRVPLLAMSFYRTHCANLPVLQMAALSERSQRLEAELQAVRSRESQLQEELQAAKRAASALQRTPSKIGGGSPEGGAGQGAARRA